MEFMRLDHGVCGAFAKAGVDGDPKSVRLIMGNPIIMQSMARLVPDVTGSYAPVTVLIDQRPGGVHLELRRDGKLSKLVWKCRGFENRARSGRKGQTTS